MGESDKLNPIPPKNRESSPQQEKVLAEISSAGAAEGLPSSGGPGNLSPQQQLGESVKQIFDDLPQGFTDKKDKIPYLKVLGEAKNDIDSNFGL
jgi:hypothetical protein